MLPHSPDSARSYVLPIKRNAFVKRNRLIGLSKAMMEFILALMPEHLGQFLVVERVNFMVNKSEDSLIDAIQLNVSEGG